MTSFSIWAGLGFSDNPYDNTNLRADATGDELLVGRDVEVGQLQRRLGSGGTHPSIEGPTGVGKSSLIAVAAYRMERAGVQVQENRLFVPARNSIQVTEKSEELEDALYKELAQTLIAKTESIRLANLDVPDTAALDKWLNAAQYRSGAGSVAGFGATYGSSPNSSEGFSKSGFREAVRNELRRVFPTSSSGAIICVLDNLELLQTVGTARQVLEELRDTAFSIHGVRWVLCGARGIVSRARSARLSGFFGPPTVIGPLSYESTIDLVRKRIEHFAGTGAIAPVTPAGFEFIYRVLNRNLRDALAHSQFFSEWLFDNYVQTSREIPSETARFELLVEWTRDQAGESLAQARGIQPRVWTFFDDLCAAGGICRADEHEIYGFTFQQQLAGSVTALADRNLLVREIDPENGSRHIAVVTPQGWLVYFERGQDILPGLERSST